MRFTLVVKARSEKGHLFTIESEVLPVFPRKGELVEFTDGMGVVDSVTWKPVQTPATRKPNQGKIEIVVECIPVHMAGPR